jgi:hypothetical protein
MPSPPIFQQLVRTAPLGAWGSEESGVPTPVILTPSNLVNPTAHLTHLKRGAQHLELKRNVGINVGRSDLNLFGGS